MADRAPGMSSHRGGSLQTEGERVISERKIPRRKEEKVGLPSAKGKSPYMDFFRKGGPIPGKKYGVPAKGKRKGKKSKSEKKRDCRLSRKSSLFPGGGKKKKGSRSEVRALSDFEGSRDMNVAAHSLPSASEKKFMLESLSKRNIPNEERNELEGGKVEFDRSLGADTPPAGERFRERGKVGEGKKAPSLVRGRINNNRE